MQISKFHLGIGRVGERFQKVKAFKIHYFENSLFFFSFFFLSLSDGPSPCSSSSRFATTLFHHNVGNTSSLFLLHLFLPRPTDISWLDDNSFSFFTWSIRILLVFFFFSFIAQYYLGQVPVALLFFLY